MYIYVYEHNKCQVQFLVLQLYKAVFISLQTGLASKALQKREFSPFYFIFTWEGASLTPCRIISLSHITGLWLILLLMKIPTNEPVTGSIIVAEALSLMLMSYCWNPLILRLFRLVNVENCLVDTLAILFWAGTFFFWLWVTFSVAKSEKLLLIFWTMHDTR